MGRDVQLRAVSILHGSLSSRFATPARGSQPAPLGQGQTAVVPETKLKAEEAPARRVELGEGATVEQMVNGLQARGKRADVIAIWQGSEGRRSARSDLRFCEAGFGFSIPFSPVAPFSPGNHAVPAPLTGIPRRIDGQ